MFEFKKEYEVYLFRYTGNVLVNMISFTDGVAEGKSYHSYWFLKKYITCHYKEGILDGTYSIKRDDGELLYECEYNNGEVTSEENYWLRVENDLMRSDYKRKKLLADHLEYEKHSIESGYVNSVIFNEKGEIVFNGKMTPEIAKHITAIVRYVYIPPPQF